MKQVHRLEPFRDRVIWLLTLLLICFNSHAESNLRVAIIDSFSYQRFVTTHYKEYYKDGIDLAKYTAKERNNTKIITKVFQYNNDGLDIFNKVQNVIDWKPDVVIGPRDSNHFLLLEKYLTNILVISPFASSNDVDKMPDNFLSMTYNDSSSVEIYNSFINTNFPDSFVYILMDVSCKSCSDISDSLTKKLPDRTKIFKLISDKLSKEVIEEIYNSREKEAIFVLPNNAHISAVLMSSITNIRKRKSFFIGGDGWGQWEDTEAGKLGADYEYIAYHISPWDISKKHSLNTDFINIYSQHHQDLPKHKLSFISFYTLSYITKIFNYNHPKCLHLPRTKSILCKSRLFKEKNSKYPIFTIFEIANGENKFYSLVDIRTMNFEYK